MQGVSVSVWWWGLLGCGGATPEAVTEVAPPPVHLPDGVDLVGQLERLEPVDDAEPPSTRVPATMLDPVERPAGSPVELTRRAVYPYGKGTLTHLAPPHGRWLLLDDGKEVIHLEATAPIEVHVDGLYIGGDPCDLTGLPKEPAPWVPVCPRLWRREPTAGRKTRLEWGSDMVRDHIVGGEKLTQVVKSQFVGDKYRHAATRVEALTEIVHDGAPAPVPVVDPSVALEVPALGLPLVGKPAQLTAGRFYPVEGAPGVHVASVTPSLLAGLEGAQPLERDATVVFVAFDLGAYTLDFHLGTDHPRLGWADRVPAAKRTDRAGPDGFDAAGPLQRTGQVGPDDLSFVVATFTAGFKRSHGAFHRGALAQGDGASHFGFIEEGVPFSWLQPGLATLYVTWEGDVGLRTWGEDADLAKSVLRYARQNGAPLVRWDAERGSVIGDLVDNLSDGNWSGSVEGNARSLRAGACLRPGDGRTDLVYGYFTAATPGTMARAFLAAGCRTAMLLDMNALEHTYLSVYTRDAGGKLQTHNLDTGMAVLDKKAKDGSVIPRFLAFADNRDFFVVRPRAAR